MSLQSDIAAIHAETTVAFLDTRKENSHAALRRPREQVMAGSHGPEVSSGRP